MEYTGGRTSDTIVNWVLKKAGPPSTKVTCAALKEKREANKFVLGYFGPEDSALYKDGHVAYASGEDKITFVHSDETCDIAGLTTPGIVFFRKFEENEVVYSGKPDKDALIECVKPLMVPVNFEFTEEEI